MNSNLKEQHAPVCFKRWTRKAYAVFNSLHVCVKIGALCTAYTILVSPERGFAQTDSTLFREIDLDEVEISAEAAPDVFAPAGRTITLVQRTDIERAAVQSLTDMLESVPNIDLRQRGPYGAQADVSIRGASFDQTLILINGISINDPQTGHNSLSLPIDLESVEKIEILEGPAARIFGNNALGGAINFITGLRQENYLKASATGGAYGFYRAAVDAAAHFRKTSHHLAVSRTSSDGYMHNTDFSNLNVFLQNKLNSSSAPLDLQLGYTQKDFGANGFYGAKYPDQFESMHTFFASLKADITTGKLTVTPAVYGRRNYDQYILNRSNPDAYRNFHNTGTYGADVKASLAGRLGRTNAGVLARREQIFSNNIGEPMARPRNVPRNPGKQYTKTDSRTSLSAFAEQNLRIGRWSASAGVLLNLNSYTGSHLNVYPGADVAFHPNQQLKIYASANRAMRLPTFTDLWYTSPINVGNSELKPEYSAEYELGAKINTGSWNAGASYFYRNISSAIDWIWLDSEQKWHTMNLTQLRTHGIALGGQWNTGHTAGSGFPIREFSAYYTFLSGNKSANSYKSNYVMDYLKHKLNISLTHRVVEEVYAHWQISWQDRNSGYMKYNREDGTESEVPYSPFWQFDVRVYRNVKYLNVFAEASNLGNRKHQDIGNITLPGLWVRAGVAVTLTGL